MNEGEHLSARARRVLVAAGAVASGLAFWLTVWLPHALARDSWPSHVWAPLLLAPALGVLVLSLQRREVLLRAATLGQEGSRRLALGLGIAMLAVAAVCLVTGPRAGPVPLLTVAYVLAALAYLHGVRLCRRADEAPGWSPPSVQPRPSHARRPGRLVLCTCPSPTSARRRAAICPTSSDC